MIYGNVDGKKELFASSIIDHAQLSGRDAYGAHSIGAIRGLSALLRKIRSDIENNQTDIKSILATLDEHLASLTKLEDEITAEKTRAEGVESTLSAKIIGLEEDKVNKITETTSFDRAYIIEKDGSQNVVNLSTSPDDSTLIKRLDDGRATVAYAQNDNDIVNVKYLTDVKNEIASDIANNGESVKAELDQDVSELYNVLKAQGFIQSETLNEPENVAEEE